MEPSRTLAQSIALILAQNGVKRMFGVPGGGSSLDLIDAGAEHNIEFILCRTETSAALMAAVTGELTGVPGIVLTGIGPGAASAVNGIAYASLEKAPLIVFTDAHDIASPAPPHQIFDQQRLFQPISKAQKRLDPINSQSEFSALFHLALTEPPGPVHIDLSAKDARTAVKETYDAAPPKQSTVGSKTSLEDAMSAVRAARYPALIIGHQCRPTPRAAIANKLANALGGPIMTTYKAKGVISEDHKNYVGLFTGATLDGEVLSQADLIVFCGTDPVEMIGGEWLYDAPVCVLSETSGLEWPFKPKVEVGGALTDSAAALVQVETEVDWDGLKIQRKKEDRRVKLKYSDTNLRSPDEIINSVSEAAPQNARLTVDAGAHMFSAMSLWPARAPFDVLKSNGLSTMGYAVPAAIASWLEEPERPVIAVTGDGGMLMCLSELSTAARLDANITVIVMNDAALSLIDIKQQRQQRAPAGVRYPRTDFATTARGMGLEAWTVGAQDPLEFALGEAIDTDGPTLLDVSVDPTGYLEQMMALRG